MHVLRLKHDWKREAAQMRGQYPAPSHATHTIEDKDTVAVAPDGSIQCLLLKNRIPDYQYISAFEFWKTVNEDLSNRGSVTGSPMLPGFNRDGALGLRNRVPEDVLKILTARQGVLGYSVGPHGKCYKTPLYIRRPELLDENQKLIERADALYAQALPQIHARQWAEVVSKPCWRLWDTCFTTCYVVRELRCAYHCDTRNLRGVMSAIMPMGQFAGGELVLARWRVAIAFKPGDLLLFDPQQLHGNLPFEGERLSAVFLLRAQDWRLRQAGMSSQYS